MHTVRSCLIGLLLAVAACGPNRPRDIAWDRDSCAHCHMSLADPRFAAELLTRTGKAIVFDDVGCLTAWMAENSEPVATAWVESFTAPHGWIRADSAVYLRSDTLRTPMASGLAALRPGAEADSIRSLLGGSLLTWSEILRAPHHHPAAGPS